MKHSHPLFALSYRPRLAGVVAVVVGGALFAGGLAADAFGKDDTPPVRISDQIAALKIGVTKDPSNVSLREQLAILLGERNDYAGAVAQYTAILTLKPDDVTAYKSRGIAEYNLKAYAAAKADFSTYDRAKPGDPDIDALLGQTCVGDDAIQNLRDRATKNPKDANASFNLGVAYVGVKDYRSAVVAFTNSNTIKADPQTLFNRALAYDNLGLAGDGRAYAKAVADAAAALALKPDYADAELVKADAERAVGMKDLADQDYRTYLTMAGISDENRRYASRMMLAPLIVKEPDEANNYFIRGTAYVALRNFDPAIRDLRTYTTMKPDDATGFYNLGVAYYGKKDNVDAAINFEKAFILKPDYDDAANQAALAYKARGDANVADATKCVPEYEKAVTLFEKVASMGTTTPKQQADALYNEAATLETKAKVIDSDGPLKAAIAVWHKWIILSPTDPELSKIKSHVQDLSTKIAKDG